MKRGISLIAVLMFMLAATTASIVVYKWIGSEGFASGSRLKQSEAYQASESGLDAAYAWLSYKAADAGAVIGDYLKQPQTIRITEAALGSSQNDKKYEVYLTEVGADKTNKIFKLKFLSVGIGRDNSRVVQEAVYNVEGLYKMKIPKKLTINVSKPNPFDEQLWGNTGVMNRLELNKAVLTQSPAIKDQGKSQALNSIKIKKNNDTTRSYLILDGNYYTNNGIEIDGDLYVTGSFDFCPKPNSNSDYITGDVYVEGEFHPKGAIRIDGNAYLKGGMNPNRNLNDAQGLTGGCTGQAGPGVVAIGGSSTIENNFFYYNNGNGGSLGFSVAKNLVMTAGQIDLSRTTNNSSDALSVDGDVCIQNAIKGSIPNTDVGPKPFFGKTATSSVFIPGPWTSEGSKTFKYSGTPSVSNLQIRSEVPNASNINNPTTGTCSLTSWKDKGADPMDGSKNKDYKAKIDTVTKTLNKSCQNTPIQFNKSIYDGVKITASPANWVHREDKPGSCSAENGKMVLAKRDKWVDLGKELQNCWNAIQSKGTQSTELYEGEWLVVYIRNKTFFNSGDGALTSGKYIIINELYTSSMANSVCTERNGYDCTDAGKCSVTDYSNGCPPNELPLPPTAANVNVMLYLPLGFPNKIVLSGTQLGTGYNYFIFSDYDINVFDTGGSKKLRGNIFMNKCSLLNTGSSVSQAPYLDMERNPTIVEDLMGKKILCDNPNPKNPDHCLGGTDVPGRSSGSSSELELQDDNYIIPIGPRLKVELESKSLRKRDTTGRPADSSVLVMPRVLNLPKDAFKTYSLDKYYNFLYLNGAKKPSQVPAPACELRDSNNVVKATISPTTTILPSTLTNDKLGVYTCSFGNNSKISPFYLKIQGETGRPKITLTADETQVDANKCTKIHINADNISETDMTVMLVTEPNGHGWDIRISNLNDIKIPAGSMEKTVEVCHNASAKGSVKIKVIPVTGCEKDFPDEVTIGLRATADVYRKDATTGTNKHNTGISNLLDCPTSGKWSSNCAIKKQDDWWICSPGETVTLSPPGDNFCEIIPSDATLSAPASNGYTFNVSYKWKQHDLTLSGDLSSITLTPAGSTATAVTCSRDNKCLLYSGLQYTVTNPNNLSTYVTRLNGMDISGNSPKLTLVKDTNTLRISTGNNQSSCQYDPFWCNDFYTKGGDVPAYVNKKCFFATHIDQFCSSYNLSKINGVNVGQGNIGCWGNTGTLPPKADGGYYILAGDGNGEIPTFNGNIGKSHLSTCTEKLPSQNNDVSCEITKNEYFAKELVPIPTVKVNGANCVYPTSLGNTRSFYVYNPQTRDYDGSTDRWNTKESYSFSNADNNRGITLSKVTCNNIDYDFGVPGILCGNITIKENPNTPWCKIVNNSANNNSCYTTGTGVDAPIYGCNSSNQTPITNGSPQFRYTTADNGSASETATPNWTAGNKQPTGSGGISARKNAHIYMYEITCGGTTTNYGSYGSRTGAIHCEGSFSVVANQSECPGTPTTYNLTCNPITTTVTVGTAITPPQVQCSGNGVPPSDLEWNSYAPNWANPDVGTYTNIGVSATNGNCQGKTATCSGTITVNPPPCQYNPADCGGIAKGSVIATAQNITGASGGKCFFATNATEILTGDLGQGGVNLKVNGQTFEGCQTSQNWGKPLCSTKLASIAKKDGGYYIYFGGYINNLTTSNDYGGLSPGCR